MCVCVSFPLFLTCLQKLTCTLLLNKLQLCGNGTRLVIGYRRSFADSDQKFRQKLDRYFDLKLSHMAIYETPKHEIVIIQATRRPFSSFFEKFKELELAGKSGENV